MKLLLLFLFFICQLVDGQVFGGSSLKFVYVIARHGTRAPTVTFPFDKYPSNDTRHWPDGPGHLTSLGKTQAYNIGVNLRQRYDDFLYPFYHDTETRVTSNLYARDLMSAQLLAAGLYPPIGEQIWNPSLLWQPVPVWPEKFDVADVTNGGVCPRFDTLQKEAYEKAYYDLYLPNKEFIDYVQNVTGRQFSNVPGIKFIHDALEIQEEHGFKLPNWATSEFRAKLSDVSWRQYRTHIAGLPEMIRLTAGPVLEGVVKELESQSKRKIVVLMSHDNTIFSVAQALGFADFEMPQMASYLIFEVHGVARNSSDVIQAIYFRNSSITSSQPSIIRLGMPICHHPCRVDKFIDVVRRFIPRDWDEECFASSSVKVEVSIVGAALMMLYFIFSTLLETY